jgi:hypothetical protein
MGTALTLRPASRTVDGTIAAPRPASTSAISD